MLLSVVDHYNRVAKDTDKRVVGVLLGETDKEGKVDVTTSFAVPFEEDPQDSSIWYLDHNFLESMTAMFRKVNCACAPSSVATSVALETPAQRTPPRQPLCALSAREDRGILQHWTQDSPC